MIRPEEEDKPLSQHFGGDETEGEKPIVPPPHGREPPIKRKKRVKFAEWLNNRDKEFFEMSDFTLRPVGPKVSARLNAAQKPGWVSFSQTIGGKSYEIGDGGKWYQKVRNKPQPGFIHAFVLGMDDRVVKNGGVLIRYPIPINFHRVVMPAVYRLVKQLTGLTGLTKKKSDIFLDGCTEDDFDQIQNAYDKYDLQGNDFVPI